MLVGLVGCVFCQNNLHNNQYRNDYIEEIEIDPGMIVGIIPEYLKQGRVDVKFEVVEYLCIDQQCGLTRNGCTDAEYPVNPVVGKNKSQRERDEQKKYKVDKPQMTEQIYNLVDGCKLGETVVGVQYVAH